MIVFLDTNTLDLLCNPNSLPESIKCKDWFYTYYSRGVTFFTSDICDYEIRRGLVEDSIRKNKTSQGLSLLDNLRSDRFLLFLPVTKEVLDVASSLWAKSSVASKSNKEVKNIDVDIIISAHYQILESDYSGQRVVIATINVKDLSIYCEAINWQDIRL